MSGPEYKWVALSNTTLCVLIVMCVGQGVGGAMPFAK